MQLDVGFRFRFADTIYTNTQMDMDKGILKLWFTHPYYNSQDWQITSKEMSPGRIHIKP